MGQFDVLQDNEDDSSTEERETPAPSAVLSTVPPSYEDLSMSRADEETVLTAVYGDDFTRQVGVWGCAKLQVNCRPPDVDRDHIGSELTLSVQLGKQYPYVVPTVELRNVKGLSKDEQRELLQRLDVRAHECAQVGSVVVCELVQIVEDYLLEHNQDPNLSEWEQMKAREKQQQEEKERLQKVQEAEMKRILIEQKTDDRLNESQRRMIAASGGEVEKELARQMEALAAADRRRKGFPSPDKEDTEETDTDDEDEDAFDEPGHFGPVVGTSRYETDFLELGLLGRGGGGEVVKVRNRLDRRLCK